MADLDAVGLNVGFGILCSGIANTEGAVEMKVAYLSLRAGDDALEVWIRKPYHPANLSAIRGE